MIQSRFKILSFIALVSAFAILSLIGQVWASPLQNPPSCTAGNPGCDPVLHAGNVGQIKAGALTLNTFGAALGLLVDKGKVGIGFNNPATKLDVRDNSA